MVKRRKIKLPSKNENKNINEDSSINSFTPYLTLNQFLINPTGKYSAQMARRDII